MTTRFDYLKFLAATLAPITVAGMMLVACDKQGGPVTLTNSWPTEVRSYDEVTRNWTRTGTILHDYDKVLEVHATFKSPEWRTAWVNRRIKREKLPESQRAPLLDMHKAEALAYYEVEFLVTTYDERENDLHRGTKSVWRVSLVDEKGREVEPTSIKRDRRSTRAIRGDFPSLGDFAFAYKVRFPKDLQILGDGVRQFSIKMSSASGVVEMVWRDR